MVEIPERSILLTQGGGGASLPCFFFLREFLSRALLSERVEQAIQKVIKKIGQWKYILYRGGSRILFRRGCTRLLLYFNTNKPHRFFLQNTSCIRKLQVISEGRRVRNPCTLSLDPPLRKKLITHSSTFMYCYHSRAITSTDNSQSHQRTLLQKGLRWKQL